MKPPWIGLQDVLCFEMACASLGPGKAVAAGWGDNSQLWQVGLWGFLRALQVAMNSLAFGEESHRTLRLCPLALNLKKEASPGP